MRTAFLPFSLVLLWAFACIGGCGERQIPPAPPLEATRTVTLGTFSFAMPLVLRPMVWRPEGWDITFQPLEPRGMSPAQNKGHWEKLVHEHMADAGTFLGRFQQDLQPGVSSLWFISRVQATPPGTPSLLKVEGLFQKDDRLMLLRADGTMPDTGAAPQAVIAELTRLVNDAYGPWKENPAPVDHSPLVLPGPGEREAYFVANTAANTGDTSLIVCSGDGCHNSSSMLPVTLGMRLLHGLFGPSGESVSHVRHGYKQAGRLPGRENVFVGTRKNKGEPPAYTIRAIWENAEENINLELRQEGNAPPDEILFLARWDALLAGFSQAR